MKLLYKNLNAFVADGRGYYTEIHTDGEKLYVTVYNSAHSIHIVNGRVSYNGEERSFSLSPCPEEIVVFDYAPQVRCLTVTVNGSDFSCSWHGSSSDPAPDVSITYTGIRANDDFEASFVYSGDAPNCALIAPIISYLDNGSWVTLYYVPSKRTGSTFSYHIFGGMPAGTPYKVKLVFACYASPTDSLEEYIGLTEYTLPTFVLTGEDTPLAPNGFSYAPEVAGMPFTVSWNPVNDPEFNDISYRVTREINRSTVSIVYSGTDTSFIDTLPGGTQKVAYSVKSISDDVSSAENIGEEIEISSSNVYIGVDGRPIPVASIYIGKNGAPTRASTTVFVG